MSLKTKLLELFKYDPSTDGAQTFNIKQALNDNWDKLDTWAQSVKSSLATLTSHASSKSNPHGVTASQAGAVPTGRKVNGKALSGDVTLTATDVGAIPLVSGSVAFTMGVEDGKLYILV